MVAAVTPASIVRQSALQVHVAQEGSTILLSLGSDRYYRLDAIGSAIWAQLRAPIAVTALTAHLRAHYDVDAATCELDTLALLQDLIAAGLAETVP